MRWGRGRRRGGRREGMEKEEGGAEGINPQSGRADVGMASRGAAAEAGLAWEGRICYAGGGGEHSGISI